MLQSRTLRGVLVGRDSSCVKLLLVSVNRRALLAQVSSRKATEEALLSGFDVGRKQDDSASLKRIRFQVSVVALYTGHRTHVTALQESVAVTVEFPADEGEKGVELFSLATLGRSSVEQEEEGEKAALVPDSPPPSRKKSASAPRRTRVSSIQVLAMLDVSWIAVDNVNCCYNIVMSTV